MSDIPISKRKKPKFSYTLAITGASGAQYGLRLLKILLQTSAPVYLLISDAARVVIKTEMGLDLPLNETTLKTFFGKHFQLTIENLNICSKNDWFSPIASGSSGPNAMVICPASGGTLSAIASGASNNLIERAADVALKERRQLILVPRETPYSEIHLENMLKLTRLGATVIPASPGFYHNPKTIDDLIDFIVSRIIDHLGIDLSLTPYWGSND